MMSQGSKEKKWDTESSPVSELSDDLLVEIISRVPYKSTCLCKCVSKQWRDLISHPDHRKKLPRSTLAGFFYRIWDPDHPRVYHGYQSVSGNLFPRIIDPSLPFLPGCEGLDTKLLDCRNGLLLCRRRDRKRADLKILDYMVCNPATEKWVVVPATEWSNVVMDARLGFDPIVSSHFHVFEFVHVGVMETGGNRHGSRHIKAVGIYSSKAGTWTQRTAWDPPIALRSFAPSAFFDGAMYLTTYGGNVLAVIDVEGNHRLIPIPMPNDDGGPDSDVYLSRGQLYLAHHGVSELSVWALEDSNSENWTLKHNVNTLELFRKEHPNNVRVRNVMVHPEENAIFIIVCICICSYVGCPRSVTKLMSYQMDSRELRVIHDLESGCRTPYLQYVPFFSESLADGH